MPTRKARTAPRFLCPPIAFASVNDRRYLLAEILKAEFVLLKRFNVSFVGPEDELCSVALAAATPRNHSSKAITSSAPAAPFPGPGFSAGCSPTAAAASFHDPGFPAGAAAFWV